MAKFAGIQAYTELNAERLRTQRELTRRYRLDNEVTEASVLNRDALQKVFAEIADSLVSVIMSTKLLSRHEKEDFLKNLSALPVAIENVAAAQSRLRKEKEKTAMAEAQRGRRKGSRGGRVRKAVAAVAGAQEVKESS